MSYRQRLVARYRALFAEQKPEWPEWEHTVRKGDLRGKPKLEVVPTIPFVGAQYAEARNKVLVYGSAENLAVYLREPESRGARKLPPFFEGDRGWDRHRAAFDMEQTERDEFGVNEHPPWPYLHLAPADDGGLILYAALVTLLAKESVPEERREFVEQLAIGNLFKFAGKNGTSNRDPCGVAQAAWDTLPYVCADLETLRPDIIVVPSGALKRWEIVSVIHHHAPNAKLVPVFQFNRQVANNTRNWQRERPPLPDDIATALTRWDSWPLGRDADRFLQAAYQAWLLTVGSTCGEARPVAPSV